MEKREPGLYTGSFRDVRPEGYDEIWLIVRRLKAMPNNPLGNIRYEPLLSPSQSLLYWYLDEHKAGRWNKEAFESGYAPRFFREMSGTDQMAKLRELKELSRTKSVLLACYCADGSICHRNLVRRIIDALD